eukprot:Ihof_evm1s926 gene=Ihof_evmTU1s926
MVDKLKYNMAGESSKILYNLYKRLAQQSASDVLSQPDVGVLSTNSDVATSDAIRLCGLLDLEGAIGLTTSVLEKDPHHLGCLQVHVVCLTELKRTNALFIVAHRLVDERPSSPLAWLAVACYYFLTGNQQLARRYFSKSIELDEGFGLAYVGFGHSFSVEGEHDQAMSAYTTAVRLLRGCPQPLIYAGMEHANMRNFPLAEKCLETAAGLAAMDPLPWSELGVIHYRNQEYIKALQCLTKSLDGCRYLKSCFPNTPDGIDLLETVLSNTGHTLRKLKRYDEAVRIYKEALNYQPSCSSTHAALAFTYHLMGQLDDAIMEYHT